jgi:hypothetical protein
MKVLVIYLEDGSATVVQPAPPNAATYGGRSFVTDDVPALPSGHKYVVENGQLVTALISSQDQADQNAAVMKSKLQAINKATTTALDAGFTYSSTSFSLSQLRRELYERLWMKSKFTTLQPFNVPTMQDTTFSIQANNIEAFYSAYTSAVDAIIEAERVSRKALRDA